MGWPSRWPDGIVSSELVTAAWLDDVSKSLAWLEELAYVEFTADVTISATTEATANSVVSAGAITYEAVPHLIEFFSPSVTNQSDVQLAIVLYDSTTALGELARVRTVATGGTVRTAISASRRLTPTAASHTYNVKAWTVSGTATVGAGAGATGVPVPGYIRVTRIPVGS